MAITFGEVGEGTRDASLRPVVAALDAQVSRLARGTPIDARSGIGELLESWAVLVDILAPGPARELRECPVCEPGGLRAATRRGCWTGLAPLARTGTGQAATPRLDGGKG